MRAPTNWRCFTPSDYRPAAVAAVPEADPPPKDAATGVAWKDGWVSPSVSASLTPDLRDRIQSCGFFPEFVADSVALALGDETVVGSLVHHEAMLLEGIYRHLSVLVITPSRLIITHTDENPDDPSGESAISTTEAVGLHRLGTVTLTRFVKHPEAYGTSRSTNLETWLTIGWGTSRRLEVDPADCGDPNCTAEHGLDGRVFEEDLVIRMSPAADGEANVEQLLRFGAVLQRLTGRQ